MLLSWQRNKPFLTDIKTGRTNSLEGDIYADYVIHNQLVFNRFFSPTKKWIVFPADKNIWKIKTDGKELQQLTHQGRPVVDGEKWGVAATDPNWSSDGENIYYSIFYPTWGGEGTGFTEEEIKKFTPDIKSGYWVMDSDGKNKRLLSGITYPFGWIPNTKKIIYIKDSAQSTYVYDVITGKITQFFNKAIDSINWSQNGDIAAYTAKDTLYIVDKNLQPIAQFARKKEIAPLYDSVRAEEFLRYGVPSADGKKVLLVEKIILYDKDGNQKFNYKNEHKIPVVVWDLEKKQLTKLPIFFSYNTIPFWSKDSKKIVYIKQNPIEGNTFAETEDGDVFIYDFDNNHENRITNTNYQDFDPVNGEF